MPHLTRRDPQSVNHAHDTVVSLLQSDNPVSAVAYVEALTCDPDCEHRRRELLAVACTDVGAACGSRDLIERGVSLWHELDVDGSSHVAYNLANAELALWEVVARADGVLTAWENNLDHLDQARTLYARVGRDTRAPKMLRIQALTNVGNSYDIVGRNVDAVAMYNEALTIDPTFAMALGNRAISLRYFAPYMRGHERQVLAQAAADLRSALRSVPTQRSFVSPGSEASFRKTLEALPDDLAEPSSGSAEWSEPYLRWCAREGLFLHVWPRGLSENTTRVDPLFTGRLTSSMGEGGIHRLHNLIDAFNALKQDYTAARYLLWLAIDPSSPIIDHADDMSARTLFIDTFQCARWGIRTGMLIQAHAASTNVLDKIAGFVHLYFATGRVWNVSFRSIDRPKPERTIDAPLRAALAAPESNLGLLALFDLSHDLARGTALKDRVDRRHRATHRFVVAHNIMVPESHDWVDRVETLSLIDEASAQLQTGRAALTYLARTIDRHEAVTRAGNDIHSVEIPSQPVDTRLSESI
jgi:tetratricopeptide (TPR) repeat protein